MTKVLNASELEGEKVKFQKKNEIKLLMLTKGPMQQSCRKGFGVVGVVGG